MHPISFIACQIWQCGGPESACYLLQYCSSSSLVSIWIKFTVDATLIAVMMMENWQSINICLLQMFNKSSPYLKFPVGSVRNTEVDSCNVNTHYVSGSTLLALLRLRESKLLGLHFEVMSGSHKKAIIKIKWYF